MSIFPFAGTFSPPTVVGQAALYQTATNTYTTSGPIALTDLLSLVNASSAVTMTVANGGASIIQLQINNLGAGVATISGTIAGSANSVALPAAPNAGSLTLLWLPAPYSTWIII